MRVLRVMPNLPYHPTSTHTNITPHSYDELFQTTGRSVLLWCSVAVVEALTASKRNCC